VLCDLRLTRVQWVEWRNSVLSFNSGFRLTGGFNRVFKAHDHIPQKNRILLSLTITKEAAKKEIVPLSTLSLE
jgi:hypothetical protein